MAEQLSAGFVYREKVDTIFEPGYYGHGSGLFDGGTYGVLIVFKSSNYKYFAQVDLNFGVGFYYRVSHGDGNWSDWVKL